ncbi:unnamed protein product [Closterium sp. Naga37s-1]|nr:unnamed protein product [Closterium sp. Naga37s-1]
MDILSRQYGSDEEGGEDSPREKSAITASPPREKHSFGPGTGATLTGSAGITAVKAASRIPQENDDNDSDDDNMAYRILAPPSSAAPPVSDALLAAVPRDIMTAPIDPSKRNLQFNPTYDQLWTPVVGPAHPHNADGRALGLRNHRLGSVQDASVDSFVFDEQYHTFQAYGYSVDPASVNGTEVVGDKEAVDNKGGATVYNVSKQEREKRAMVLKEEERRKKAEEKQRKEEERKRKEEKKRRKEEERAKKEERKRKKEEEKARKAGKKKRKGEGVGGAGLGEEEGEGARGAGEGEGEGEGEGRKRGRKEKSVVHEEKEGEEMGRKSKEEEREEEEEEEEEESEEEEEEEEEESEEEEEEEESEEEEEEEEAPVEEIANPASESWLLKSSKSPWAGKKEEPKAELTEEQKKYAEEHALKKAKKERGDKEEVEEKSTFHGKQEKDYQGRSWIAPPKDALNPVPPTHCYIPKRWIHTWSGHTKGVSAIRFFPKYGHLLLSASMDTKIKIWDVPNTQKCMRTYMGHSKAVRDICFANDGLKFVSCGYDRNIKLWDTETGQVTGTFSTGKIPYVVKLHPDDDKQNILLAGMSDKKIMQWDTRSGEITQEYDQHLGAVNTITFLDDNRRFVTSSDDKSLRVWEFGIPVVVKYISEPHMHSMPAIAVHPNKAWVAAQSLDNQIIVYGAKDRFRLNRKKRFAGHIIAGYACQVNFSPDGRFIMSGDGEGKLWFWDWKTCKVFRTVKCHDSVCIGCEWHPLETSKVATCGWDGLIKYWD